MQFNNIKSRPVCKVRGPVCKVRGPVCKVRGPVCKVRGIHRLGPKLAYLTMSLLTRFMVLAIIGAHLWLNHLCGIRTLHTDRRYLRPTYGGAVGHYQ